MKPFESYQYLEGTEMTDRDKIEVGSKFWNGGKWDNFVAPFLPKDCRDLSLVDMGCNSGLFLKLASDRGFERVIGVDSDARAVQRGIEWRDKVKGTYKIIYSSMEKIIDDLPIVDYTILANSHYYFTINDWLDYLDKLRLKTLNCIVVTAEKRHLNRCWASADFEDVKRYFNTWSLSGFIDELPFGDDQSPRRLWGLDFSSSLIEKVSIDSLDCGNHVQDNFYKEIDNGVDYHITRYYRILKSYRKSWSGEKLNSYVLDKIAVYEDLKENGLKKPLLVGSGNLVLDGNHRYCMMKTLGYKEVFIRRT